METVQNTVLRDVFQGTEKDLYAEFYQSFCEDKFFYRTRLYLVEE